MRARRGERRSCTGATMPWVRASANMRAASALWEEASCTGISRPEPPPPRGRCGKSTLLKILAGVIPIDEGQRVLGTTTRIGYFSQMRSENLTPNFTVLEEIMKADPELREEEARAVLGSFMFRKLDCEKRVEVLSGGEKSRLSLVKFLVNPPNLLLMDEPTTHLDLMSVEALSQALKRYEGTLVFISHDVHFIRSLAEKTLHICHGTVTPYAGGYDYYLEKSGLLDNPDAMDQ